MDEQQDVKVSPYARKRAFAKVAAAKRSQVRGLFAVREVVSAHRFGRVGAFENRVAKRRAASNAASKARRAAR